MEAQARADPVGHAFARWDLDNAPDRTRFVTLRRGGVSVGYLLIWLGVPGRPVVHWVSADPEDRALGERLPPPPFTAVVPIRVDPWIAELRGPAKRHPLELREFEGGTLPTPDPSVRPLGPEDAGEIRGLIERNGPGFLSGYGELDLGRTRAWGAFVHGQLVAVARTQAAPPGVRIIGGIFTDPLFRGHGFGRAVTAAATRSAMAEGVRAALYVRSDNAVAREVYERLGYRIRETRLWVEAGSFRPS